MVQMSSYASERARFWKREITKAERNKDKKYIEFSKNMYEYWLSQIS